MICVTIQGKTLDEIFDILDRPEVEMAEIRLDRCRLSDAEVGELFSGTDSGQMSTGIIDTKFYSPYPDFPRVPVLFGLFNVIRFQGTNKLTADYINRNQLQHVGIIAADFPGEALISAVIACNFR